PEGDHGTVDTVLKEIHSGGVPQHVGRNTLRPQGWALFAGDGDVLGQQVLDSVTAQAAASCAWEQRLTRLTVTLAEPVLQDRRSFLAQGRQALLASLAVAAD